MRDSLLSFLLSFTSRVSLFDEVGAQPVKIQMLMVGSHCSYLNIYLTEQQQQQHGPFGYPPVGFVPRPPQHLAEGGHHLENVLTV